MSAITSAGMMQDSFPSLLKQRVGDRTMRQEQQPHPPPSVASQQPGLTASQHVGCWAYGQPALLERQSSPPSGVAPEAAGHVIGQAAVAEVDRQRPSAEALAPNRNSKVRGEPAVHDEYLARDVGGLVRRQERRRTRDFGRVSPATQGCSTANPTLHRGILCLLGI